MRARPVGCAHCEYWRGRGRGRTRLVFLAVLATLALVGDAPHRADHHRCAAREHLVRLRRGRKAFILLLLGSGCGSGKNRPSGKLWRAALIQVASIRGTGARTEHVINPDSGCSSGVPSHCCIVLLRVDVTRTKWQNMKDISSGSTAAPRSHLSQNLSKAASVEQSSRFAWRARVASFIGAFAPHRRRWRRRRPTVLQAAISAIPF